MEKYLNSNLLILIPLTMGIGLILKAWFVSESDNKFLVWYRKALKSTKNITGVLYFIDIVLATAFGFIYSKASGWRWLMESILVFGLCHGAVCCFIATKLYDTVRRA